MGWRLQCVKIWILRETESEKSGACYSVLRQRLSFLLNVLGTNQSSTGPRGDMMIIAGVVHSAETQTFAFQSY